MWSECWRALGSWRQAWVCCVLQHWRYPLIPKEQICCLLEFPVPVRAVICVGSQCLLLFLSDLHKVLGNISTLCFPQGRAHEWGKSSHVQIPSHHCCPSWDLRNKSISGMMKFVSSVFQAGMALYKIVPKNPYYFWSVMSLIMQVCAMLGLTDCFFFFFTAVLVQKCSEGKHYWVKCVFELFLCDAGRKTEPSLTALLLLSKNAEVFL